MQIDVIKMRLWHQALIPKLPRSQLLGLHREICALRGNGWGKKHSTVDYVFTHPMEWLIAYHSWVMDEMINRGYNVDRKWYDVSYRGRSCEKNMYANLDLVIPLRYTSQIYPEHNDEYLRECIENLKGKGVDICF